MRAQRKISRRELLAGAASMPLLSRAQTRPARPKIAALATTYFKYSHAQHIVDRFLEGYGWNGRHHHPPMDLVSLYVDQVGNRDLSKDRAKRFPSMKIYPTIAETLTLGGSKLAVDGIVVIGEHGRYPRNEKGQTQYPRYEFFQEMFKVFRAMIITVSKRFNVWWSAAAAERRGSNGSRPIAGRTSGKRTKKVSGRRIWSRLRYREAIRSLRLARGLTTSCRRLKTCSGW
jgi:hypothetical protein